MRPIKDNKFIDTNVLLYCYSKTEPDKKSKALGVSAGANVYVSTQVLKEFANILYKKFRFGWDDIIKSIAEVTTNYIIFINHPDTIKRGCAIANKYLFSFYDSLIIASALEADCKTLYTEDLQHNQIIENKLRIINPFISD